MEMGSFLELQFMKGKEFYSEKNNIARLNSGRAAIWHSLRVLGVDSIWLPYYQCNSVRDFLKNKGVNIKYYHIDKNFNPLNILQKKNEAVLLVNYFGIMSYERMSELASNYSNVIIDNCQAFFCEPLNNCMNVYSCRKFMGVPDGSYVIGKDAEMFTDDYIQCYSSDTSVFLLQRIEYGCEGKAYNNRMINENRLDSEDCMNMSKLTQVILDGTDYDYIINKRTENFIFAKELFDEINCINPSEYFDSFTVPMVYPFVFEEDELLDKLLKVKHFQGHLWSYLCNEMPEDSFEYWLSRYIIPITIDQRYDKDDLENILWVIKN